MGSEIEELKQLVAQLQKEVSLVKCGFLTTYLTSSRG